MTTSLYDFIADQHRAQHATDAGTTMHERLRRVSIDGDASRGDAALISHIIANPNLVEYFAPHAQTEVPIAGTINGKFISRRIDRMITDTAARRIKIMDYKTDIDCTARRAMYKKQLGEYCDLLQKIYPDFVVTAAILWTHDWTLEQI